MNTSISKSKQAMCMSHVFAAEGFSKSDALLWAWYLVNFRTTLQNGVVRFSYIKKDGSLRLAKGTLNPTIIPEHKLPKGDMSDGAALYEHNYAVINYYDIDKQDWRAFRITEFKERLGYAIVVIMR